MTFNKPLGLLFSSVLVLTSCNYQSQSQNLNEVQDTLNNTSSAQAIHEETYKPDEPIKFSREPIVEKLQLKIDQGQALIVHIFVPLCDNENQGIVAVSKSLGDGTNLKTNLYWGAGYGIKSHFRLHTDWKLLKSETNIDDKVLERVVFYKEFSKSKVYMIADAYRGDRMAECLTDYFNALAGKKQDSIILDSFTLLCADQSDLIAFNGHDGLMDNTINYVKNQDGKLKDAAVIACISYDFFEQHLNYSGGYPLVTTTNLLAPEAYVMEAIVEAWAEMKTGEEIRLAAGDAYDLKHSCSQSAARRLFKTGW